MNCRPKIQLFYAKVCRILKPRVYKKKSLIYGKKQKNTSLSASSKLFTYVNDLKPIYLRNHQLLFFAIIGEHRK